MDKKLKTKWTKALRSGKYTQAKNYLKVENENGTFSHCCLGVLCEVSGKNKNAIKLSGSKSVGSGWDYLQLLGNTVARELGLGKKVQERLAEMNDAGSSFKKIANWIDKNL